MNNKEVVPSHPLRALPPVELTSSEFFEELSPLFAGSVFCLIREDKTKLKAEEEAIKKDPSIRSKPKVIHTTALSEEARAEYQRAGYGIFFTVNAFKGNKRTSDTLTDLKALYVDIDAPKALKDTDAVKTAGGSEALTSWKRSVFAALTGADHEARKTFPYLPTLVVETKNGFHAYWYLSDFIPFADGADESGSESTDPAIKLYLRTIQQLIKLYGGDDGAKDLSRVLRSPFSWHIKDGTDQVNAYPCLPVYYDCDARVSLEEYAGAFPKTMPKKQTSSFDLNQDKDAELFSKHFVKAGYPTASEELSEEDYRSIEEEVLRAYPKCSRPSIRGLMDPAGIPEGSRNASLFCVVSAMREDGCRFDEASSLFTSSGYNGLSQSEILAVISSAYKSVYPRSFGWNDPTASRFRTPEEEAHVKSLYSQAITEKIKKKMKAGVNSDDSQKPSAADSATFKLPEPLKGERGAPDDLLPGGQKKVYLKVEEELAKMHPNIKNLEGHGFHIKENGVFRPISQDDLVSIISKAFRRLGLTIYNTSSPIKAKIPAWGSLDTVEIPAKLVEPGVGISKSLSAIDVLPLENGVLELKTLVLRPYKETEAWRFKAPASFDPKANCPRWLKFIDEITEGDLLKSKLLQEISGYCLTSSVVFQKAFIFLGEGSNGKSVFTSVLQYILGESLCGSVNMQMLHSNFGLINIEGKRLNVINEISDNFLKADVLKRLIDGSPMEADRKNLSSKSINPFAKLVFTVNRLPRLDENSLAVYRRIEIIKFNRIFRGAEVNNNLFYDLQKESAGILNWMLQGLTRLREQNGFTESQESKNNLEEFKENGSHIISFLHKAFEPIDKSSHHYPTSGMDYELFSTKFADYSHKNHYQVAGTKKVITDLTSLVKTNHLPKEFHHVTMRDQKIYGLRFKS